MISKELLSDICQTNLMSLGKLEVVGSDICLYDCSMQPDIYMCWNIYELAHKCKEWARDNEFFLRSFYDYEGAFCYISAPVWADKIEISKTGFCSDTEPEAVFRACQWILDNKDSK